MPSKDPEKRKEYLRQYRQKNKEKAKQYQKDWNAANPDKRSKYSRDCRARNPERAKELSKLQRTRHPEKMWEKSWRDRGIRISWNDYVALLEKQYGKCAICRKPKEVFKKRLAVDHDHYTGKIRGLLCFHCNSGIGKFEDSPELLVRALDYLKGSF